MLRENRWRVWGFVEGELIHAYDLTEEERVLARNAANRFREESTWDNLTLSTKREIMRFLRLHETFFSDDRVMRETFEAAVRDGKIVGLRFEDPSGRAIRLRHRRSPDWQVGPPAAELVDAAVSAVSAAREIKTWFAVEIIDEIGEPVGDVELVFEFDDSQRRVVTDGSGRARLNGITQTGGSVRFAGTEEVRAKLDERWRRPRNKWREPPRGSEVVEVCRGRALPSITLEPEITRTIVTEPPCRIRILDESARAIVGAACTVTVGGAQHKVTSDSQGWVEFPLRGMCPEWVQIKWDEQRSGEMLSRRLDVVLDCHNEDNAASKARLRNLGYPVDDLERAIALFQLEFDLPPEPVVGDEIPRTVIQRLHALWEARHD